MDELGFRFWVKLIGLSLAFVLAGVLIMVLVGRVWYAWGLLGMFLFLAVVSIGFGLIVDRREAKRRSGLDAV